MKTLFHDPWTDAQTRKRVERGDVPATRDCLGAPLVLLAILVLYVIGQFI